MFGVMSNQILLAVPFFILMGLILEKSKLAENLLIQAKNIKLEKDGMTSVFEDEVKVQTKNKIITI